MNLNKTIFLSMVVVALSGCASTPQKSFKNFWTKDGFSYEDAIDIEAACKHDALTKLVASNQEINLTALEKQLIDSCMKSQGFRWGKYEENAQ